MLAVKTVRTAVRSSTGSTADEGILSYAEGEIRRLQVHFNSQRAVIVLRL